MHRSNPTVDTLGRGGAPVKVALTGRPGRRRGLREQRLVDEIDGALVATTDPLEYRTLAELQDRVAILARRSLGIRGWWA